MKKLIKPLLFLFFWASIFLGLHLTSLIQVNRLFTLDTNVHRGVFESNFASGIDTQLVFVNIAQLPRKELSLLIDNLGKLSPKVMATFICFDSTKVTSDDAQLSKVLQAHQNKIILVNTPAESCLQYPGIKTTSSAIIFDNKAKSFQRWNSLQNGLEVHIAQKIAPQKSLNLKSLPEQPLINYQRNFSNYLMLSANDVLRLNFNTELVHNKIVYIGYFADSIPAKNYTSYAYLMLASVNVLQNILTNVHLYEVNQGIRVGVVLLILLINVFIARLLIHSAWWIYWSLVIIIALFNLFGSVALMFYWQANYDWVIHIPYTWVVALAMFVIVYVWEKWT